jgi:hypothetical protein
LIIAKNKGEGIFVPPPCGPPSFQEKGRRLIIMGNTQKRNNHNNKPTTKRIAIITRQPSKSARTVSKNSLSKIIALITLIRLSSCSMEVLPFSKKGLNLKWL